MHRLKKHHSSLYNFDKRGLYIQRKAHHGRLPTDNSFLETHGIDDYVNNDNLISDAVIMPVNINAYMEKDDKMSMNMMKPAQVVDNSIDNTGDSLTNNLRVDSSMVDKAIGIDDKKELDKIKKQYEAEKVEKEKAEYFAAQKKENDDKAQEEKQEHDQV
jgi:hypothetical protein